MAEAIVEPVQPQNPTGVVEPKPTALPEGHIAVNADEFNDLKHKAEVSSQNFERLRQEQEKVNALETEIAELRAGNGSFQDERVDTLKAEIAEIKERQAKADVLEQHPKLKEVWSEFETFRADPENKGMSLKTAAKAFMAEKEISSAPPRKGLESPTGGDRTPIQSGMTAEEVKRLRETDYKKYSEMVRKGQIKMS